MSSEKSSSEICENNNDIATLPPKLKNLVLPARKDIGKVRVDWSTIEAELPVDLLLVTVKDHEFVNCYYYLKNTRRCWVNRLGMVDFGEFGDGKVKVALIRCDKGATEPGAALLRVKNGVEILGPKAVVCVGYCGTVNPAKAKLGDVVISTKLATYANKRITEDGTEELRGIKANVSRNMGDLIPFAADGWEPPLEDTSDFEVGVHRTGAVMLSGPEVVNNLERRQELLKHYPDALAVEMEGEGLYAAAYDLGIEWAVIKGVADFADGSKTATKDWQPFASAMAASVVYNMFQYPDVLQNWNNYKKPVQGPISTAVTPAPSNSPSLPIQQLLRSFAGTTEGKKMYNGRMIEYSVSGRFHSLKEPWVYDATARDAASGVSVKKKHFETADAAICGAIEELIRQLKERKIVPE